MNEEITIKTSVLLKGLLHISDKSKGIVIFVHGSGSSRFSPRNQFVARILQKSQLSTLLFDLLTEEEEKVDMITREYRFDIPLLTERLVETTNWLIQQKQYPSLPIGYFGASTGAAAALIAATKIKHPIHAIVSRGGRPDLAMDFLPQVRAPTLLIVGGYDFDVIDLNHKALEKLRTEKQLDIIPEASHLFEEPGKLEEVSKKASEWFLHHFSI